MNVLHTIRGKVKEGARRGKLLGFPTANVSLHKEVAEGVYISYVVVDGKRHEAVTFIGSPKTFNENDYKAEAFILDFSGNLYGKWIRIQLVKFLRENKKFTSRETLIKHMKKDVVSAKSFFAIGD